MEERKQHPDSGKDVYTQLPQPQPQSQQYNGPPPPQLPPIARHFSTVAPAVSGRVLPSTSSTSTVHGLQAHSHPAAHHHSQRTAPIERVAAVEHTHESLLHTRHERAYRPPVNIAPASHTATSIARKKRITRTTSSEQPPAKRSRNSNEHRNGSSQAPDTSHLSSSQTAERDSDMKNDSDAVQQQSQHVSAHRQSASQKQLFLRRYKVVSAEELSAARSKLAAVQLFGIQLRANDSCQQIGEKLQLVSAAAKHFSDAQFSAEQSHGAAASNSSSSSSNSSSSSSNRLGAGQHSASVAKVMADLPSWLSHLQTHVFTLLLAGCRDDLIAHHKACPAISNIGLRCDSHQHYTSALVTRAGMQYSFCCYCVLHSVWYGHWRCAVSLMLLCCDVCHCVAVPAACIL